MILASQSPRRAELLRLITPHFAVRPADVDETPWLGEIPEDYVERLARLKARTSAQNAPSETVLGADTVVVQDGQLLGKPVDELDARRMLGLLSGRTHRVLTGIAVVRDTRVISRVVETQVTMRVITPDEMTAYWHSGEPQDKAGAYGIQGLAARFVTAINGSYTNVVGLPLVETEALLHDAA